MCSNARSLLRTETLLLGTELKSHESLNLSLTSEPKMYLHINCYCVKHMVGQRFYFGMGKEEFVACVGHCNLAVFPAVS